MPLSPSDEFTLTPLAIPYLQLEGERGAIKYRHLVRLCGPPSAEPETKHALELQTVAGTTPPTIFSTSRADDVIMWLVIVMGVCGSGK